MSRTLAPPPPPPAQSLTPDPFALPRESASQLSEALKRLEGLETQIAELSSELASTEARLGGLHDAEQTDFEQIDSLSLRRTSIVSRLELLSPRLLASQHGVQDAAVKLSSQLSTLYQRVRVQLMERETDRVVGGWHEKARVQNRGLAGAISSLGKDVIDAQVLEPALHPNASDPLEDNVTRPWSQQRDSTMRICRQESARLLELTPKLLEKAAQTLPT